MINIPKANKSSIVSNADKEALLSIDLNTYSHKHHLHSKIATVFNFSTHLLSHKKWTDASANLTERYF